MSESADVVDRRGNAAPATVDFGPSREPDSDDNPQNSDENEERRADFDWLASGDQGGGDGAGDTPNRAEGEAGIV